MLEYLPNFCKLIIILRPGGNIKWERDKFVIIIIFNSNIIRQLDESVYCQKCGDDSAASAALSAWEQIVCENENRVAEEAPLESGGGYFGPADSEGGGGGGGQDLLLLLVTWEEGNIISKST